MFWEKQKNIHPLICGGPLRASAFPFSLTGQNRVSEKRKEEANVTDGDIFLHSGLAFSVEARHNGSVVKTAQF